jgi:PucR C-terminal helix-turn-helix domain
MNQQIQTRNEPWRELPPAVADAIEPELPAVSAAILAAIAREVPEYARPLEGSFGRGIQTGVTEALSQFVALIRDPESGRGQGREIYVGLGRGELHQGRSLDSLLAAYRVGARVAWRHLGETCLEAGIEAPVMNLLAESIFAYIDGISAESVEGYSEERAAAAGERERRRYRLVTLLTASPPADEEAVRSAARDAEWTVPKQAAPIACAPADLRRLAPRLPSGSLAATLADRGCVIVPDPDGPGRGAELERSAKDLTLAVGPAAAAEGIGASWTVSMRLLDAIDAGEIEAEGVVRADRHLMALALSDASELLQGIGGRRLAPFAELTPRARQRMEETLLAYLRNQGSVAAIATELHVHQQTVRYRLAKLRELLGEDLDDPDARFELEAVLRAGLQPQPGGAMKST